VYSSRNSLWRAIQRKTVALPGIPTSLRWREGFCPRQAGRRSIWRAGSYNPRAGRALVGHQLCRLTQPNAGKVLMIQDPNRPVNLWPSGLSVIVALYTLPSRRSMMLPPS
jgi:hypothetical protein